MPIQERFKFMILIHVSNITPRLSYIFNLVFEGLLKTNYRLTTDIEDFGSSEGVKIAYGKKDIGIGVFIQATDLLFEQHITKQKFEHLKPTEPIHLYKTSSGVFPHDLFASAFYLVTRYEEYIAEFKDRHGRYKVEDSLAFKLDFITKPLINNWCNELRTLIQKYYPDYHFSQPEFTFQPTIDIDNAYAYKHKGFFRSTFASLAHLFQLQFGKFFERTMVHMGLKKDPYDTFDKQIAIHDKFNTKPIYFILLGNFSKHDRNLSHNNPAYINLIKKLNNYCEVGMHPSYTAANDIHQMSVEKERLEKITGLPVTKSRAHYIRIAIPQTYRMLIELGIKEDYSMGYATQPGFRASIASPFFFFDLEKNEMTNLKIHPFVVMDTTLKKYLHIKAKDLIDYLFPIIEETRMAKGNFTFIFHNESMGGARVWKNWGNTYEDFFRLLTKRK